MTDVVEHRERSVWRGRLPIFAGFAGLAILLIVLGGWGTMVKISGGVIAEGRVQVDVNQQVVQHPEGGVVADILMRDGDKVAAGDIVVRLDGLREESDLAILEQQILEIHARQARIEAEQSNAEPDFGRLHSFAKDTGRESEALELEKGQRELYQARLETFSRKIEQLREQSHQLDNQIEGTLAQRDGVELQLNLTNEELYMATVAYESGAGTKLRMLPLQKELAQLKGEIGVLDASVAQLKLQISSIELEILRLESTRREEAIGLLRDIGQQLGELLERRSALVATLERLKIRAPVSGVVHGSTIFTNSAVLQPSAPVMFIVPEDARLDVHVRVDATQVDRVVAGQTVTLRFPSFDARKTPEIFGEVVRVSPDVFTDEVTGQPYYLAEVVLSDEQLTRLGDNELLPGMPVEAIIQTEERTPLSYLVKPLGDYFVGAFRER